MDVLVHAHARWLPESETRRSLETGRNPNGGRRYFRDFTGRAGGRARYIKEVDAAEQTIRFAQEIDDSTGRLIAVHEKFPVDLGHKKL